MPKPGATKALLSLARVSTMRPSRLLTRHSNSIPTLSIPGTTKALLSKSLEGPAKQMPPSPRKKNWRTVDRVQFGAYLLDRGVQIFDVLDRGLRSLMQGI